MRSTRRRALFALSIPVLVAAVTLSGCTAGNTSSSASASKQALTLGITADITGWDPSNQPAYQNYPMMAVWDTLIQCDKLGKPLPGLAESWKISADNRTISATLRSGQKFSDGTPADSAAVKATFEFSAANGGGAARYKGIKVDAPDSTHVSITWPTANPLIVLNTCNVPLTTPKVLAAKNFKAPVGSGPYVLDASHTTQGSVYSFTKNDSYWDAKDYPYKKLAVKVLPSDTAVLSALKTGQIDGSLITTSTVSQAKSSGLKLQTLKGNTTRLLITDHLGKTIPALGSVDVRRAMNMVFDKDAVADKLYLGNAKPAYQIFRPGSDAYIEGMKDAYPYDVAKAKQLMKDAGYESGFTLTIPVIVGSGVDKLLPYVTQQLALINIKVEQQALSGPNMYSELLSGKFPVPLWPLGNYGESLQDIYDYVLTDGIWNVSHQDDPTIDSLWKKITSTSGDQRKQAEHDINEYITKQAWFVPMAYPDGFYAYNSKITVQPASDFAALNPLLRDFK
ncbi:ABC transporter substrate-binding protein [Leifsonia sp. NPDC058292]|uniref:ABC transporter substrate-binding protein n=1 Tax=Leifsonia sp. NPDC058292 TaxID=3346428 RepID=UPI0036DD4263